MNYQGDNIFAMIKRLNTMIRDRALPFAVNVYQAKGKTIVEFMGDNSVITETAFKSIREAHKAMYLIENMLVSMEG